MTEKLRTIDITPKWSGIVNPLLHIYRTHSHESGDPRNLGTLCSTCTPLLEEFRKMARAADLYNEKLAEERRLESLGGKK